MMDGKSTWGEGDIEVLPEGLKVKPPASMAKKLLFLLLLDLLLVYQQKVKLS
jgi:hypothetical protein